MITAVQRRPFTASVLTAMRTTNKPVGDGVIPEAGAWVGQPNGPDSYFEPYLVVSEIVASHSSGPINDSEADWQFPYLVEYFGASRDQCSWIADKGRGVYQSMKPLRWTISGVPYGVQKVRVDSVGQPVRVDQVEPPIWHSQDGITLWIGKGR